MSVKYVTEIFNESIDFSRLLLHFRVRTGFPRQWAPTRQQLCFGSRPRLDSGRGPSQGHVLAFITVMIQRCWVLSMTLNCSHACAKDARFSGSKVDGQ